jgi:hypothetical protein
MKLHLSLLTNSLIVFAVCIALSANAQRTEKILMNDNSIGNNCMMNSQELFVKILKPFNLKQNSNQGIVLKTCSFGVNRIPTIQTATLPEVANSFWGGASNSERKKALSNFLIPAKSNIEAMVKGPCDQTQTNLYRALVYVSHQFSNANSSKSLILFSDLAPSSSAFNSGKYINNPKGLLKDFDKILQILQKDSELPDFTGVDVEMIAPMPNDFSLYLGRFWTKFFKQCGAKSVTVRTAF